MLIDRGANDVPLHKAEYGYRTLDDGRKLTFEVRWTEEVSNGERLSEHATKGKLDGEPVSDDELAQLLQL